jgi:hypothetical protein
VIIIFCEALPITIISMYIMLNGGKIQTMTIVILLFTSIVCGAKIAGLGGYKEIRIHRYIYTCICIYIYLWMRTSLYPPRPAILAPQTIEVKRRITIVITWIFPPFNMMYIEMIVMGRASQKIMITSPFNFYFF